MSDPAPGFTRPPSPREVARERASLRPQRPTLGLVAAVSRALRLGLTFRGRAARDEFWLATLAVLLVYAALIVLKTMIVGPDVAWVMSGNGRPAGIRVIYNAGIAGSVFSLATAVPLLALGWRRLHDRDRAGWWLLVPMALTILVMLAATLSVFGFSATWRTFVDGRTLRAEGPPWLGPALFAVFATCLFLLVQLARRGTAGPNRFGPDPLEVIR